MVVYLNIDQPFFMAESSGKYVLQCRDKFGSLVVFERSNYEKHKNKHRELDNPSFCPKRIIQALQEPTFTIKSKIEHTLCYYYEEYSNNGIMIYTKVIVFEKFRFRPSPEICFVKTAFRIDHIQELKYGLKPSYNKNL